VSIWTNLVRLTCKGKAWRQPN